ncbi:uncharacterized protein NESG_00827 [Nematocida ausubeli]|uniref:Exonuclease domain-containing protein n=1 Tax=Nematocida ausubeli (strain ATCC PRA-371 / ERTm2) TaxID=1913371 RepID=A0A086J3F8_NEMA1|nr:uncharacterized protein NESG_00827 [Nematocida ausubeli]KFG26676.1 hypothetical protein NESG_00827 [Nematocida ausubeli]
METKPSLDISYKKHEQISLEKLAEFITACRLRKNRTPITNKFNTSDVNRILVIINESRPVYLSQTNKKENYTAVLKEYPLPEDIPIYMHSIRTKTPKKSTSEEVPRKTLLAEDLEKYLVKDINAIYTEGIDHRIYTIPISEKTAFYSKFSTPEVLSQVATLRPLKIEKVKKDVPKDEYTYYSVVKVNAREMVSFDGPSKYSFLSIDCEMVLTDIGCELARISIIDGEQTVLYDQLIEPAGKVTDYLSEITGITASSYDNKCTCKICAGFDEKGIEPDSREVLKHTGSIAYKVLLYDLSKIIGANTILIGHSISHDLFAMNVFHEKLIDTSLLYNSKTHHRYKLKALSLSYLNKEIQKTNHSSVVDSEMCLDLISYLDNSLPAPLQYQKMKNLSIGTDYKDIPQKPAKKGTPPVDYIYINEPPKEIEDNTVIIRLNRTSENWSVFISNT